MNEKEIGEIRRRLRPDKNNITHIRGCYVNEKREIVSLFDQPISSLSEEAAENMLATLKRTLSGTPGKNLLDLSFDTDQVADSDEHRLLMTLRNSALKDDEAVQTFFTRAIETLPFEGNYLILLTCDTYDVPYRSTDGAKQADACDEVYSYLLCSICPIKTTKPVLGYCLAQNEFRNCQTDEPVAPPELGFLFPAFDNRSANIYNVLYYVHDSAENHSEFVDAVFHCRLPMPAAAQKEAFESLMEETLAEDCRYDVMQTVHGHLCELIEEHKADKDSESPVISKDAVKKVLESCGVSASHVTAFDEKYNTAFGSDAQLCPQNLVDSKLFEVRTPDVTIRMNPEYSGSLETRTIDGKKYILIRADEDVEVNGVNIRIAE